MARVLPLRTSMDTPTGPRISPDDGRLAAAIFALFAILAVIIAGGGPTRAPQPAAPPPPRHEPGLAPSAIAGARGLVESEVNRGAFAGAALALGMGPRIESLDAFGEIGWSASAAPVSTDSTLYDLASLTKAVATTVAVLLLADDGLISLDAPVQPYLPEFEGVHKERITWRHLLTHTSGLPAGAVIRGDSPRERAERLLRTRTLGPGHLVTYSDIGFLVLWEAAERVAGEPLEDFLHRRVWEPLGMRQTRFSPGEECEVCAPSLRLSTGLPFQGRPSDELARLLGGVTGNAGLFSTGRDLAIFAAMIGGGGELDGVRILREATVRELFRQQPGAGRRSLGWVAFCPEEEWDEAVPCSRPIAYGHTGWTGTSLWMEPRGGRWAVLLTNRSYDPRAEPRMEVLRADLFAVVTSTEPGGG